VNRKVARRKKRGGGKILSLGCTAKTLSTIEQEEKVEVISLSIKNLGRISESRKKKVKRSRCQKSGGGVASKEEPKSRSSGKRKQKG